MPKINLDPIAVTNAGIAANPARVGLEFCVAPGGESIRFSPGLTYNDSNSQIISPGQPRVYSGVIAQGAFSFSAGGTPINGRTVIDVTEYT